MLVYGHDLYLNVVYIVFTRLLRVNNNYSNLCS